MERFEEAKELHTRAQRTERPKAWHELRIGIKRLRYTVENLMPELYALWSDNLKRLQDLLGEVHDLDVLAELVKRTASAEPVDSLNLWEETIGRERAQRVDSYRQLTLGRTSIWNDWRHGLPQGAMGLRRFGSANRMSLIRRAGKRALRLVGRGPHPAPPALASNTLLAPGNQWYPPALAGASTFAAAAVDPATVQQALDVLKRLTPDA